MERLARTAHQWARIRRCGRQRAEAAAGEEVVEAVRTHPCWRQFRACTRRRARLQGQVEAAGDVGAWASDSEDEAGAGGGILGAAADYLLLAQPVPNIDPEQPAGVGNLAPNQPAPMANIVAPQPVVQRMPPGQIMSLRVAQQGVNHGLEHGGLAFPMNEIRLRQYLKDAIRLSHVASSVFTKAPRSPASQTELLQTLDTLCRYVGAYNQAHITQEERTLLWMATHFTEGAASAFRASLATARTQPSTTGIGQGSVLWRALFHMVVMYDNPQSKLEGEAASEEPQVEGTVSRTRDPLHRGLQELPGSGGGHCGQPGRYQGGQPFLGAEVRLHPRRSSGRGLRHASVLRRRLATPRPTSGGSSINMSPSTSAARARCFSWEFEWRHRTD